MPANPQVTEQMVETAAAAMERGVCSTCGAPAVGDGGGYTDCGCAHPNWREATNDEKARAALTAALADHVVVHRSDVTYDMVEAGISALASDDARSSSVLVCDIYRAMISAAPLQQKEG